MEQVIVRIMRSTYKVSTGYLPFLFLPLPCLDPELKRRVGLGRSKGQCHLGPCGQQRVLPGLAEEAHKAAGAQDRETPLDWPSQVHL